MKRVILICLFISLLASIAPNAAASGDFQAKYDVQYDVLTRGSTIVTQNITLTNLQTNLYPQKYSILIDSLKIQNVIAYDPVGPIHPQILDRDGRTEIILEFNEKVIGLGKQLTFTLRYEDEDITRKNGSIWEITIPGIANNTDIDIYDVRLNVPQSFGPVAYMSPLPLSNGKWNKSQMISGGISIAYGTVQSFDTDLAYTIENTKIGNIVYEIALPPDTAYQKVFLREISPKPQNIKRDDDGNWMAQYNLYPTQKVIVHAKLVIQVSIKPFDGYTESLTNRSVYIKPEKYWESTDPKIKEIALQNKTARDIYRYVVSTLSYDNKRVNESPIRKGALSALDTPNNSICMEFTDLFIAIARAAGIPAREAVGYAYTTNNRTRPVSLLFDVLHSWPEYYDDLKKVWIPIDPTWAKTTKGVNYFDKLDFNHIVFALHGIFSDYPYPAGFYKDSDKNSQDVSVSLSIVPYKEDTKNLTVTYVFPKIITPGITTKGNIIIENDNSSSKSDIPVAIQSTPFDIAMKGILPYLPPMGNVTIPISIPIKGYLTNSQGVITTVINGNSTSYAFTIKPFIYQFIIPIIFSIGAGIILLIIFLYIRRIWMRKRN